MEVSQIYRQTNVKTVCNDVTLLTTVDLLEVELSGRAQEDEEERRKQKGANTASASLMHRREEEKENLNPSAETS